MLTADASALVTGGASGLGRATVRRLHASGAGVTVFDLPSAAPYAEALIGELGDRIVFAPGDVTRWEDVERAVAIADSIAPLRIAVTAAGIAPARTLVGASAEDLAKHLESVIAVNLLGTLLVVASCARAMARRELVGEERGVIICTASIAAFDGQIGQVAYAASKAGVAGMTLPAARELARNAIRVMTIAPGIFDTPMLGGVSDKARESVSAQVPHPARLGSPDEYAALVMHVIENPMLNGEVVRLDGAIRMGPR
jgi:NAD(P)-dependent dehydrogenase (short-subunit alcohol dehydrogenase family)